MKLPKKSRCLSCKFFIGLTLAMSVAAASSAQIRVTIDHNSNTEANRDFKFKRVPSPSKDDAATNAKILMIEGELDSNGSDLYALVDGILPAGGDQPRHNVFFNAGTGGARFRFDLGAVIEIAQINTYSWHPNSRGPQVYRVWASDGSDPKFNPAPKTRIDPTSCGWRLIATVDTRSDEDDGGQYGVSISDARGSLGRYRYLLFDCYVTEITNNFGNTFYSEFDVIAKP